ncbi:MAG: hypothetical protein JXB38_00545, partial [Anaerolineales bacterium]|nr:hypothetical protein [Anaerolineales bacterium]
MTTRRLLLLGLVTGLALGSYIVASALTHAVGFPLDDAWIHQTYARNLGMYGEWSFYPGQPSAGSTAPLWSVLLAVGHILDLGPFIWTYLLGWVTLWALAVVGAYGFQWLVPGRREAALKNGKAIPAKPEWSFWAGALLALEWHLVW